MFARSSSGIGSMLVAWATASNLRPKLDQMFWLRSLRIVRSSTGPRSLPRRPRAPLTAREEVDELGIDRGGPRAHARPVAQLLDPLLVGVVERDRLVQRVRDVLLLELPRLFEGAEERA